MHLKEAVVLWEAHAGAGSWQDLWTCGERGVHAGAGLLAGLVTLWKGPMLEQFMKDCSPREGLMLEKFVEDCLPWEGPHAGAGEECEESSS